MTRIETNARTSGVKIVALIKRLPGISWTDFIRLWQIDHPRFVLALPGLRRYVQNPSVQNGYSWPYDGVAELWFDSIKDVAIAFSSPEATPMRQHETEFIGSLDWLLAHETEVARQLFPEETATHSHATTLGLADQETPRGIVGRGRL